MHVCLHCQSLQMRKDRGTIENVIIQEIVFDVKCELAWRHISTLARLGLLIKLLWVLCLSGFYHVHMPEYTVISL